MAEEAPGKTWGWRLVPELGFQDGWRKPRALSAAPNQELWGEGSLWGRCRARPATGVGREWEVRGSTALAGGVPLEHRESCPCGRGRGHLSG